jgi:hypothetical protein
MTEVGPETIGNLGRTVTSGLLHGIRGRRSPSTKSAQEPPPSGTASAANPWKVTIDMADNPGVTPVLPPQGPTNNETCDAIDARYEADPSFTHDWTAAGWHKASQGWDDDDGGRI